MAALSHPGDDDSAFDIGDAGNRLSEVLVERIRERLQTFDLLFQDGATMHDVSHLFNGKQLLRFKFSDRFHDIQDLCCTIPCAFKLSDGDVDMMFGAM